METEGRITKPETSLTQRLLPAVLPVIFIAITYVDPGKWVAAIEGGARFGNDLVILMFVFSLAAVLCQYLSASIAVITGRDLAQICTVEYDTITCIFLGLQAELSMIALDLSMILGTAHALNLTFGFSLFTCVLITSLDAFLFPVVSSYLENSKAKFICMWLATVALFSYFFGVLASQRDTSFSVGGSITNLSGESTFALMSLLGASIMPHNFYLHSSIVQQNQGSTQVSKGALCHDHLFAIACVFSGVFLINYILMNSAANVFYSTGLDLLTFQDALSLMDQVFRSLMAPFALVLLLVLSYHTTALTWKFSAQSVLLNFFKLDIPGWSHHSSVRAIALIPALLCSWHSGAEGTYQLMIFTQIVVALLLPSSVIPLFRIAASRSLMGVNRISQFVEYLLWITYIGMFGLMIVFVVEMVFGNSEWASNLRWTSGAGVLAPYTVILVTAVFSVSFTLKLVVTPLKSVSSRPDVIRELSFKERIEAPRENKEETLPLTTIEENSSDLVSPVIISESVVTSVETVVKEEVDDSVEKTLGIDGNSHIVKEHQQTISINRVVSEMEAEGTITKPETSSTQRLLPAVLPVIFIAITYVDPGKWVAAIEGGARFGNDLVFLMFVFSLAAVLCQYLSASIAVITGRDLAQICTVEYDTITCIFLGLQAELSMIALDLSMILGTAHALNLTFGFSLFTCVLITSLDAFLFPVVSSYLENSKAKFICMWLATVALFSYFFGVLASQRDTSFTVGGSITNLSGESTFALMSLLGASIMPHNFYLHSSIVQQNQGSTQVSKGALCHDHLFAIACVFSGVFLINYILMNSAANVFYSTGLDLLTFQDALSLMDQVFRSLMAPFALVLLLVLSYHTTALTWKFSAQSVLLNFFKLDIPGWSHHSSVRAIALIPALLCSWHSGAEGTYQLMIFTQIVVALLLPSSVIPLFRIAASRSLMGVNRISQFVEYLLWITYIGMFGLMIVFVVEMVFGNSEWASNLRWTSGAGVLAPYTVILVTAVFSVSFTLKLVVTPLKSLTTIEENSSDLVSPVIISESVVTSVETVVKEEVNDSVEKTLGIDGNSHIVKEHQRDIFEPEEQPKIVLAMNQSPTSNGPPSFKSLGGKTDDIGSGPGSLSKLAGLGRAARRQLATSLDEFWKLLFDLHGEMTQDARTNKLDKLLGIESKLNPNPKAPPVAMSKITVPETDFKGYNPSLLSSYQQLLDVYTQNANLNVVDPEKRYHSLRLPQASSGYVDQPATIHGYQIKSYINQTKQRGADYLTEPLSPKSPSFVSSNVSSNFKAPGSLTKTQLNGLRPAKPPGFPDPVVSRNNSMQPERNLYNLQPAAPVESVPEKKYYSMPDISGLLPNREPKILPDRDGAARYGTLRQPRQSDYTGSLYRSGSISGYGGLSYSNLSRDAAAYTPVSSYVSGLGLSDTWSMWSKQPSEQFGVAGKVNPLANFNTQEAATPAVDSEANILKSLRLCIVKLLKLEGSEWLFKQNGGLDEDLVDRVAARERFLYELESNEASRMGPGGMKIDEAEYNKYLVTSVPNCGEGCVWRIDLIKSFGVWCIHRILELSLMESRPELWGKYTYVLNRLQGIIEPSFSKPRVPTNPCFCLQLPDSYQRMSSPPKSINSLPPPVKPNRGKCTTASGLLDIVKDVETAISCRKGRPGTAAGDVAFPKGKENLASVLKRYKRRLQAVGSDGLSRSP
ncbi:NRAMP family [Artemisia annua]|uniref:NRAMP family n=1 Tax=Artemisia annua TaxID=35608 RepID=A0A2U1N8P6_ARTAN|nr:NRAMP family [Artemisia annua]